MLDPLPAAPTSVEVLARPWAESLGLRTLPLHVHEAVLACLFYYALDAFVAEPVSVWLFPTAYPKLSKRTRINWNIHFVSMIQSTLICGLAFWIIMWDEDRHVMNHRQRIWGYSGATGMAQALAAGYFLWDTFVSVRSLQISGWGALAHAISALIIVSLGFRPFANFYGIGFVLYELSTPFLNFHWFFDKLDMTGTKLQLYNGIMLLLSFFGCRLVWGTYLSVKIYYDIYLLHGSSRDLARGGTSTSERDLAGTQLYDVNDLPTWLLVVYLGSNTLLTILNFYWFSQMLKALFKRFPGKSQPQNSNSHAKAS